MTINPHNGSSIPRVVVAMSGGIDSSVAACLLADQGYGVVGMTMRLHDAEASDEDRPRACCSVNMAQDSRGVCDLLGVPHYTVDMRKSFGKSVQENFIGEYLQGRTPNPCIQCNIVVKWHSLYRKAEEIGAEFFSTGHHARIEEDERYGRKVLRKGADPAKDQSYALWGISHQRLQRTLLPIGRLHKTEVRTYAAQRGLKNANKAESQDICFIPDRDYGRWLNAVKPGLAATTAGGAITDLAGHELGEHQGTPFYTVGQRRGLGIALGRPQFVVWIDPEANELVVGEEQDLYRRTCIVEKINLQAIDALPVPLRVTAKIRYSDPGAPAQIALLEDGRIKVEFDEPRRAITPGQSAVFYDGDTVIGGGIITRDGLDPRTSSRS